MFRSRWAIVAFLLGFPAVLLLAVHRYLLPAAREVGVLDLAGKKQLAALSVLVMTVVLVVLVAVLVLVIRPGRFFLPRRGEPRTRTSYVDAWKEAGERMATPPEEEEEEE